jgi:hypothetical protein
VAREGAGFLPRGAEREASERVSGRAVACAQVFSECLSLTNVTGAGRNLSACVALESRVMCFKAKCLYKAADPFGCFHA